MQSENDQHHMDDNVRKERSRINQKRRRKKLMRIDYIPLGDARVIIETEKIRKGEIFCLSEFIDNAVIAWSDVNKGEQS